jgi:hypothetical protein
VCFALPDGLWVPHRFLPSPRLLPHPRGKRRRPRRSRQMRRTVGKIVARMIMITTTMVIVEVEM